MARYPDHIREIVAKYDLKPDELWQVHGSTWVIKHKAIERIGAQLGILWAPPKVIEGSTVDKIVVVLVEGRVGERIEWSFGEASPANNKNAYPWAMAEKRGKDRVILKFLAAHGDVYSEEEAEDFKEPAPARKSSYAMKKGSPDVWPKFEAAIRATTTREALDQAWNEYSKDMLDWPISWQSQADELFMSQLDVIGEPNAEAAE